MSSLKIINLPATNVTGCPRPDTVGSLPYTPDIQGGATINSTVASVNPTLATQAAIDYRQSHTNQYVKFGSATYFIDMYANFVQIS